MRAAPRPRDAYRVWHNLDLRWADNDIYGHVNNAAYYVWWDTALNSFLIEAGLLDPATGDLRAFFVSSTCRYARALRFPGTVEIGFASAAIGNTSLSWRFGTFAPGEDAPSAEGEIVQVCVDRTTERPVPVPELWRTTIGTRAGIAAAAGPQYP